MKYVFLLTIALILSGCFAKENVKPWQKGILAKDSMKANGGNNLFGGFQNHIYFSKEGSKGGGGVGGGGCGCN